MAGWRSELAGSRTTLSMSKLNVKKSETKIPLQGRTKDGDEIILIYTSVCQWLHSKVNNVITDQIPNPTIDREMPRK